MSYSLNLGGAGAKISRPRDLYSVSTLADLVKTLLRARPVPGSTVETIPHDHHRIRRAALDPYFSKTSIRRLEPVITETLITYCNVWMPTQKVEKSCH